MYRPSAFSVRCVLATGLLLASISALPKDWHINLPKKTKSTPVQQLNRDGVKAVEKHDYEKAKRLFYKAYLLDPNDPFTLNNLGYLSELEGEIDRAERYYDLAAQLPSDATVDSSNDASLKGKPVGAIAGNAAESGMQINRLNVQAIGLLRKERAPEADMILQKALALDSKNPFTLNNMGFAKEKEGELETAYGFYASAAKSGSSDPIVVTVNRDWRGKPISEVAAENAKNLSKLMKKDETPAQRIARLNLEGVSALNRNDKRAAKNYFEQAYKLDPNDAFTLNNMGYLSEMSGDRETADFYYAKASEARGNGGRVDVASRRDMEGRKIREVANIGDDKVSARMEQERQARARQGGPIELKRRDNSPATEPEAPPPPSTTEQPRPQQ